MRVPLEAEEVPSTEQEGMTEEGRATVVDVDEQKPTSIGADAGHSTTRAWCEHEALKMMLLRESGLGEPRSRTTRRKFVTTAAVLYYAFEQQDAA